jgi:tetratricopeptide (TPR) repeat protein
MSTPLAGPHASTTPPSPGVSDIGPAPDAHEVDRLLARTHLRLGMLSFARAELERLAVQGALDPAALADLAEARWRTGDLVGAGRVAEAALEAGAQDTTVLVVAAESAMADGRVSDAQRFADAALARSPDLDALFAGLPRSRVWRGGAQETGAQDEPAAVVGDVAQPAADEAPAAERPAGAPAPETATEQPPEPVRPRDERPTALPTGAGSAHRLISFAAGALRNDRGRAAVELALVLRSEPSLAPAVLELLGRGPAPAMSRSAAALEIVRGDAYRLIGRPREAEEAYGRALAMLGELDER